MLSAIGGAISRALKQLTNKNKTSSTSSSPSNNKTSYTSSPSGNSSKGSGNSYAYDPKGNKVNVTIKNGQSYLDNGQRIGSGYTVQTNGGIYKMGNDGKGYKVDSHNVYSPNSGSRNSSSSNSGLLGAVNRIVSKINNITSGGGKGVNIGGKTFYNAPEGMPDIDADTLDLLNGWYSGRTIKGSGYDAYYDNNYQQIQDRYEYYNKTGQEFLANQMLDAINRYNDGKHTSYLATNIFGDWDTGLLDLYIGNKAKYDGASPEEQEKYAKQNAILRQLYGLEEDNLAYNDLGELRADLIFGDFIDYGLNKEDRNAIPDITSTDMEIDPSFKTARMMARSRGLFGYEPLGQLVGERANDMRAEAYDEEGKMMNAIASGEKYISPREREQQSFNQEIISMISDFITSSGGKADNITVSNVIPIDPSNPSMGGVYETNSGRFVESGGQIKEISDDEFIRFMEQYYGF